MVRVQQGVQNRYFLYDSLGRLIRVRQPEQEVNTNLNLTDPLTGNSQWSGGFTYDVLGNVVTGTDANGTVITNAYDRAGRVKTRSYSDNTPTVSLFYDGKGLAQQQSPNYAKGKLTKVTSSVSETQNQVFDNLGRLKQSSQITDGQIFTSKYTHNLSGSLIEEEYPSGRIVKNELGSDGALSRVYGQTDVNSAERTYASGFGYAASGGVKHLKLGNGKWETTKFNSRLQVIELGLGFSATNAGIWKVGYEYGELDPNYSVDSTKNAGNIARQVLTVPGTSFTQTYKYDSLNRLTEAREVSGANQNWIQDWIYDRYGNRSAFSEDIAGVTNNANLSIDTNTNRFTSGQGFSYDQNGNLIQDAEGRQFTFNGENKQTIVRDASNNPIGGYFYDGEGRRVKKVTNSETTIFVYSAGKLIAEYSTQLSNSPQTKYLTEDHLGTPRVITNELGNVIARRDFMPFGEELFNGVGARASSLQYGASTDDVKRKFTGYQKDNETGLDFAEARMYESRHGRFTAVDPLLASGKSANPQTFNRYAYTSNNPVVRIDRNGKEWYYAWNKFPDGRIYAVPKWCSGFGCSGTKWTNEYRSTVDGKTTVWRANGLVFKNDYSGGYTALDPAENRQLVFNSAAEAQAQVTRWRQQAIVNFIGGALNSYSLAVSLSGADGLVAESGTEMYAAGQRAGTAAQLVAVVTGAGLVDAVVNRFGRAGVSILNEMRVLETLSRASVDDKLARYLLNASHAKGGPKAKWFDEALGFTMDNADDLARQIVFDPSKAVQTAVTEFGTKYNQVISITGANGKVIDVTFGWIRNEDGVVRLVTAIPTSR